MSDKTPGAEAMAAARKVCGRYHGEDLNADARAKYQKRGRGCFNCEQVAAAIEAAVREENEACEQSLITSSEGWRRGIVQTFAREAARTIAARRRP